MRAGRVYIRYSAGAVTWLARPTGISAAHMLCTASVAAREGRRGIAITDTIAAAIAAVGRIGRIPVARLVREPPSVVNINRSDFDRSVVDHILHVPAVI